MTQQKKIDTAEIKFPYQAEWYRRNLEHNRQIRKEYSRKYRKECPEKRLLQAAKSRAKSKISNLPYL